MGQKVDEDMIVLRLRIHEMRAIERNEEPPSHWMEWEKRCFSSYAADVCMAVGFLQTLLMSTRPSFAVALVLTFALSVTSSGFLLLCHLQGILGFILSGVQTLIKVIYE
ncbi:hypothetical protein HPP92_004835 [Vanilla planifolia]|uniref:Uncharacterized protein n=1 Tax=Vanilla planifolia TaxID=51239 RepID=A0A835VAE9_VANPL|nr:hypothetical protein HPP92_004832 [Vanilla planifolia]KAG0491437.1 hypothetical protein HPP92_004835 [Vanilla planifolia]